MNARLGKAIDRASAVILMLILLLVSGAVTGVVDAQDCLNNPYGSNDDGWSRGSHVQYDVSRLYNTPLHTQAVKALNIWSNQGCLNITLEPDTARTLNDITFYSGAHPDFPSNPAATTWSTGFDSIVDWADVYLNPGNSAFNSFDPIYPTALKKVYLHEIGHTMGLNHGSFASSPTQGHGLTVMNNIKGTNDSGNHIASTVTDCDEYRMSLSVQCSLAGLECYAPTPTGSTTCYEQGWFYSVLAEHCCPASPVIIDTEGDGFDLTTFATGVMFDINGDGQREQLAWTTATSDDAWLAMDRSGNGEIDSGLELFGNFTDQAPSSERNGFLALAEFDKAANGGDGDGAISDSDAVYSSLRLWRDLNHNGISESSELYPCGALDIRRFSLSYLQSNRVDEYGNQFKYRAGVFDGRGRQVGRWAWDVYLLSHE